MTLELDSIAGLASEAQALSACARSPPFSNAGFSDTRLVESYQRLNGIIPVHGKKVQ